MSAQLDITCVFDAGVNMDQSAELPPRRVSYKALIVSAEPVKDAVDQRVVGE